MFAAARSGGRQAQAGLRADRRLGSVGWLRAELAQVDQPAGILGPGKDHAEIGRTILIGHGKDPRIDAEPPPGLRDMRQLGQMRLALFRQIQQGAETTGAAFAQIQQHPDGATDQFPR